MKKVILLNLLLSGGLFACSTPMSQLIQDIQLGMSKSEVIEKLGNPRRTYRYQGINRWVYQVNHKNVSEIHFKRSKVIYVGPNTENPVDQRVQDSENYEEYKDIIKKSRRSKNFEDL